MIREALRLLYLTFEDALVARIWGRS